MPNNPCTIELSYGSLHKNHNLQPTYILIMYLKCTKIDIRGTIYKIYCKKHIKYTDFRYTLQDRIFIDIFL